MRINRKKYEGVRYKLAKIVYPRLRLIMAITASLFSFAVCNIILRGEEYLILCILCGSISVLGFILIVNTSSYSNALDLREVLIDKYIDTRYIYDDDLPRKIEVFYKGGIEDDDDIEFLLNCKLNNCQVQRIS